MFGGQGAAMLANYTNIPKDKEDPANRNGSFLLTGPRQEGHIGPCRCMTLQSKIKLAAP